MNKRRNLLRGLTIAVVWMVILACGAGSMPAEHPIENTPEEEEPAEAAPDVTPLPTQAILPTPTQAEELLPTALPQPAISEKRTLTLEYPPVIRAGDSDTIRLALEVDDLGNLVPTALIEGHETAGQTVSVPNLYDTHQVIAVARLDLAGVEVTPTGDVTQVMLPGEPVTFYWSVHPADVGKYRGTAWFHLRFIPKDGGDASERAVAAVPVEVEAISFLGLKAAPARILGSAGALVSSILGVPFLEEVIKWVWKRARKK